MGPDCGTAIIGGVPLGFANVVRRGKIGVVGASGTGMQQITSLIDRYGAGVSHAIGTGSRDMSAQIGGAMTLVGLRALAKDSSTSVIVIVSKPPHPEVAARVLQEAATCGKPTVACFLGMDTYSLVRGMENGQVTSASTLEEAARLAVELAGGNAPRDGMDTLAVANIRKGFAQGQRYVRGLFSGGTFCYEAMLLMRRDLGPVFSNVPLSPDTALADVHKSRGHTCLDLGSDEFTVGRPHPMIDMAARQERILQEARDPEAALLLLDIVLGYGAHNDPAGALAPTLVEAKRMAEAAGRQLSIVASICGTERDPQGFASQERALQEAGVLLAPSNAAAARLAAAIADDGRRRADPT